MTQNLFRISVNVTLSYLKDQLDQIIGCLNHNDMRRVVNFEYCRPSIGSDERVQFI